MENTTKKTANSALRKILRCLALANDPRADANVAETALRQAQALMRLHGLGETDILAAEVGEQEAAAGVKVTPPLWESNLASHCGRAFGCKVLFRESFFDNAGRWVFVGHGTRPEVCGYAFQVLHRQCKKARKLYADDKLRRCKPANKTKRSDLFCEGWVRSAAGKLQNLTLSEREQQSLDSYMGKKSLAKFDARDRNKSRGGAKSFGDWANGHTSGKSAELNNAMAGGMPAQGLLEG